MNEDYFEVEHCDADGYDQIAQDDSHGYPITINREN